MTGTLYLDAHGTKVGHAGGSLTLKRPDGEIQEIPSLQIDLIVVLAHTHFSHDAIAALLLNDIPVIFSSLRGGYRGTLTRSLGRQIHRRQAQYDAMRCPARQLDLARAVVQAKLRGAARLLRQWGQPACHDIAHALLASHHCPDLDALRGHEGIGARAFYAGLRRHLEDSPFQFHERRQHPSPDPVNALLSLAYTLLMNEVEVGVAAHGLDVAGGFFHSAADGRPTLLMDLVEPLRPLADRLCARLLRHELTPDDFETGNGRCLMRDGRRGKFYKAWEAQLQGEAVWRGERTTWRRLIHLQAQEIAQWLDGTTNHLRFWHLDAN